MDESKPDPETQERSLDELIVEVEATDLLRARGAVARGVQAARDEWIPVHLIADALALELRSFALGVQPAQRVANFLRVLADSIDDLDHRHDVH
jgi:hypothetical protein